MLKGQGHPADVFCNGWTPKPDHLAHEVLLTKFLLPFAGCSDIVRGYSCHPKIRPDAEMTIGDLKYFIELDTGTVNHPRQKRRWHHSYRDVTDFLLVITSGQVRLRNLMKHANAVRDIALFTTYDQAISDPFGTIWQAISDPEPAAIPRPTGVLV